MTADTHKKANDCPSCGGFGWKYVTQRTRVRVAAVSCNGSSGRERRVCPDCLGRSATTSEASGSV